MPIRAFFMPHGAARMVIGEHEPADAERLLALEAESAEHLVKLYGQEKARIEQRLADTERHLAEAGMQ